jgi:multicomponent Na+:H+ antiporter subunit E
VKQVVSLTIVLSAVWLAWSGHFEPLILGLGAASIVAVVSLCVRMRIVDHEGAPLALRLPALIAYVPWLGWEIVKANLDVARRILTPGPLPIAPRLVRVPMTQTRSVTQTVHANSITLTPGTISIDVGEREILVHALHEDAATGVLEGAIDRRCTALEAHGS